jgi:hypothetical protein
MAKDYIYVMEGNASLYSGGDYAEKFYSHEFSLTSTLYDFAEDTEYTVPNYPVGTLILIQWHSKNMNEASQNHQYVDTYVMIK